MFPVRGTNETVYDSQLRETVVPIIPPEVCEFVESAYCVQLSLSVIAITILRQSTKTMKKEWQSLNRGAKRRLFAPVRMVTDLLGLVAISLLIGKDLSKTSD